MKFVVDAQLPPKLAIWLRTQGHEAVSLREISLQHADDSTIWAYASAEGATIVTKDEDFALLAAAQDGPSVLWVRTGNTVNRVLLVRFQNAWLEVCEHFASGARVVELY